MKLDINLKGYFLLMSHGNLKHLKERANMKLLFELAVRGLPTLVKELDEILG